MIEGPSVLKNGMYLSSLRRAVMFLGDVLCLDSVRTICRLLRVRC